MTAGGEKWRSGQLFKTTEPLFGLVSLWTVLAVAVWVSTETHLHHVDWEKGSPVSVLGSILPESVLASQVLFDLSRWTLWIAAGCWSLRLLVPVSGWVTFGAYTLHASMFWENLPWFRHKFVLPALLLFIHAMWFQCYRREFRAARGALLSARICPAWVPFLGIYSVATFYGLAGVMKIWRGGLEWGDGLSLQLWMYRFGDEDWLLTRWILEHRTVAMVLQSGAMAIECLSFLAVVIPRFRTPLALGVIGMHIGIEFTFGIPFASNVVLVTVFLLPWTRRVVDRFASARSLPSSHPAELERSASEAPGQG